MSLISLFVRSFPLLALALLLGVCCYDGMTVQDLPSDTAAELEHIIEQYPTLEANCTGHPVARTAEFLLYNRNNPTKPIVLTADHLDQIDPKKDLIVIIHGWLSRARSAAILKLRDAYLKRYDCNLVSVNWTLQSFQPYTKAFCDVPGIGRAVSQFLCTVSRKREISLSTVHIVGHSFGAHIAGYVGQYSVLQCDQEIGRITGLDPSGPVYYNLPEKNKLDPKDALFVDVIHTDQDATGLLRETGSADFYPNCGILQPGCPEIKDVVNETLVSDALCNTLRSVEYMAESVNSNHFITSSCGPCPWSCSPDILPRYVVMGEECRSMTSTVTMYIVPTESSPPFAQGWDPWGSVKP